MSRPIDLARHFLALADRDIRAFRKLVDDPEIDEATVGFLAQQAIEKSLKATLALYTAPFGERTILSSFSTSSLTPKGFFRPMPTPWTNSTLMPLSSVTALWNPQD